MTPEQYEKLDLYWRMWFVKRYNRYYRKSMSFKEYLKKVEMTYCGAKEETS
jgi:hypothetical protein